MVEHSDSTKSSRGRVYMTIDLKDNTTRWTEASLKKHSAKPSAEPLVAWLIGKERSHDPGELVVREQGTRVEGPSGARGAAEIDVKAAVFQGKPVRGETRALPSARAAVSAGANPERVESRR
jgi:hypothetical protein